ncbi:MAG TPA: hypothetical protein VN722_11730 [Hanamia sp.]|nr:hypothetical protein [Hanamia sp.]
MKLSKLTAVLFLFALFFQVNSISASSLIVPGITKSNTARTANVNYFKASEFVKLSAKDFSRLSGKRLNMFQRISFQVVKLKMKHDLKKNPNLLITDYAKAPSGSDRRFSFLWFILGVAGVITGLMMPVLPLFFVFAFAPVAVAYITKQDKVNIKSAWIGFGVGMVLLLILVAIIIATLTTVVY